MYLAVRSDKPVAEVYVVGNDDQIVTQQVWEANRTLARDLPGVIDGLVSGNYEQLAGVIAFRGPGSFTGLRIGITVANAIAYAQHIPAVGVMGDDWLANGLKRLRHGDDDRIILPEYGAAPHITPAKK